MYKFLFLFFCVLSFNCFGQNSNSSNQLINGVRTGVWNLVDHNNLVFAHGSYINGLRHGKWLFYLAPTNRKLKKPDIIGYFENGVMHGEWIFEEVYSGISCKGYFNEGIMEGVWSYYDTTGKLAEGNYKNDIKDGPWSFYRNNKYSHNGAFDNGVPVGTWKYNYLLSNGAVEVNAELKMSTGKKHGEISFSRILNHPSFGKQEHLIGKGTYKRNQKIGRWTQVVEDSVGYFIESGSYNNKGEKTGFWVVSKNGHSFQKMNYENGLLNGVFMQFYPGGGVKYRCNFENGLKNGMFASYYPNGILKEKYFYTLFQQSQLQDSIINQTTLSIDNIFGLLHNDDQLAMFNYDCISWDTNPEALQNISMKDEQLNTAVRFVFNPTRQVSAYYDKIISKRSGKFEAYYSNGTLKEEGQYILNDNTSVKHGKWQKYNALGYVKETIYYENGILIKHVVTQEEDSEYSN